MSASDADQLIRDLAEVLEGTSVQLSMPSPLRERMLGAAEAPIRRIRERRGFPFGWASADEIEAHFREVLLP